MNSDRFNELMKAATFGAPECEICGGPVGNSNKTGICRQTPECKSASSKAHRPKMSKEEAARLRRESRQRQGAEPRQFKRKTIDPDVAMANELMAFFESGKTIRDLAAMQRDNDQDAWLDVRDGTELWKSMKTE